jgi:hypothetical protein
VLVIKKQNVLLYYIVRTYVLESVLTCFDKILHRRLCNKVDHNVLSSIDIQDDRKVPVHL